MSKTSMKTYNVKLDNFRQLKQAIALGADPRKFLDVDAFEFRGEVYTIWEEKIKYWQDIIKFWARCRFNPDYTDYTLDQLIDLAFVSCFTDASFLGMRKPILKPRDIDSLEFRNFVKRVVDFTKVSEQREFFSEFQYHFEEARRNAGV